MPAKTIQPDGAGVVTLRVSCRYECLVTIRLSVVEFCRRMGVPDIDAGRLEMAVDEACTNVIDHSYGGEQSRETGRGHPGLCVRLIPHADRVEIEIWDCGKGFDFDRHRVIPPEEYMQTERDRGLGMYILRAFVDDVRYTRAADGNRLRLIKRLCPL